MREQFQPGNPRIVTRHWGCTIEGECGFVPPRPIARQTVDAGEVEKGDGVCRGGSRGDMKDGKGRVGGETGGGWREGLFSQSGGRRRRREWIDGCESGIVRRSGRCGDRREARTGTIDGVDRRCMRNRRVRMPVPIVRRGKERLIVFGDEDGA